MSPRGGTIVLLRGDKDFFRCKKYGNQHLLTEVAIQGLLFSIQQLVHNIL